MVCCILNLAIAVALTTFAQANDSGIISLVDPHNFNEKFSGNTQVSGQLLAGLSYGAAKDSLDPEAIAIKSVDGRVCVRLTTDDGRYWSSNLFQTSTSSARLSLLSFPTAYSLQLRSYEASGLMVLAILSDDCSNLTNKPIVPGVVGPLTDSLSLFAYVNVSQGRTSAWLDHEGKPVTNKVVCNVPADGVRVTYSSVCEVAIDRNFEPGQYNLHIAVRSLTGGMLQESYKVIIK